MPIIAAVGLFFQVIFAVHAVKTGRDRYWIYIIIFFPGIGCLVYFFAEYLPDLQRSNRVSKYASGVGNTLNPGKRICLLQEQVELTPSVKNKKLLAEAYVNTGQFDQAIDLYKECQQGAYENDPHLVEGLSCAYFFKGDYENAERYLRIVLANSETANADQFRLLLARCFEALGRMEDADELYATVVKTFSGEEARCRYGMFLKKTGRVEKADTLFNEILKNARLSPKYYKSTQKVWIGIAKQEKT